ncbi:MAG: 50S ribosomal protein L10 [Dermatophilaceae bacterium]
MATAAKSAAIADLAQRFRSSGAVVLTEYRGLSVKQLTALRNSIREHATYAVVKNTLTELAAKQAGVSAFDGQLVGPSALAFVTGDPVETAKGLRDFAKANPMLVIKSGVLDGRPLTAADIAKLADLESREVLLAKLAGAMNASLSTAVSLFAAPLSQTARLVEALRAKVQAQGPVQDGGPQDSLPQDAAAQDSVAQDAAAQESVAQDAVPQDEVAGPSDTTTDTPTDVATGGDDG